MLGRKQHSTIMSDDLNGERQRREPDDPEYVGDAVDEPGRGYAAPEGNEHADGNDGGAPGGNGNALTHGATASPLNLVFHLDDEELDWIDSLVRGYLEIAPFGYEDPRRERLSRYCVMIYQEWSAAEEILAAGHSEERTVGVNDDGNPVIRDAEHHLATRERSLNTKVRQGLKDLDCLPGSGPNAAGGETVAQVFEAAVDRAKERESDGGADSSGSGGEGAVIDASDGEVSE